MTRTGLGPTWACGAARPLRSTTAEECVGQTDPGDESSPLAGWRTKRGLRALFELGAAVFEFVRHLVDTTGFPPRWICGDWSPFLGWLHILSDLAIWSAYTAIPCILAYFVLRRRNVSFSRIYWLFGAFILVCGATHLLEAIIFWFPLYRLAALVKLITAVVSWATVVALVPTIPKALAAPTVIELEREFAARKQAENALQQANAELESRVRERTAELAEGRARLHATLTGIGEAVIVTDAQGEITILNSVAQTLTGWTDDALGRNIEEVFSIASDQSGQPAQSDFSRLIHEGASCDLANDVVLLARNGAATPIEGSAAPVRGEHDELFGAVVVFRDVTQRRRADHAIRQSERREKERSERLRLLWEATTVMLCSAEPDAMLRELFANIGPQFGLDMYFNYMVNETGDALRLVSSIGISDEAVNQIARLELGQAINGTVALRRQPMAATHVQQSDDPLAQIARSLGIRAYACNPLVIHNDLLGTLAFASRTRDEFVEDELEVLRTICHYVAVAYERLGLVRQLRDADRRKNEFLATLAHELRNPLAPIRSSVELLSRCDGDSAVVDQARRIMERQLGTMVRLIDELLEMSRISLGKVELRKQRVDLQSVVHTALETSRPLVETQAHELTVTLPGEAVYLDADPVRLAQVTSNLLNNAAKYTEKGGHIWLTGERQDGEIVLSVRDTGIGIAPDHLPYVFDLFSQASPALERSHGGLGIGLSLVRGLVSLHGGKVQARSQGLGMGSEFIVRLPIIDAPDGAPEKPSVHDARARSGPKRRILVVDDNRDAAISLAIMMRLSGHETCTAFDGVEAIQTAAGFWPEMVLLDIGLPKMDGYEVARQIRKQPWGAGIVLVALTGWGQDEDKRRALEAGFDHHLTKPAEARALEKFLESMKPVPADEDSP